MMTRLWTDSLRRKFTEAGEKSWYSPVLARQLFHRRLAQRFVKRSSSVSRGTASILLLHHIEAEVAGCRGIRGTAMIQFKRILCPVDFSDFSRHALDEAIAIAHLYDGCVTA